MEWSDSCFCIIQKEMGNENVERSKVYEKFYQTCHPGLVQYDYSEHDQLLFAEVKVEESFLIWRKLVDPLLAKKHLFMPHKIVAHEHVIDYGCCAQEDFHRADIQYKIIYYRPFIYTLDKEITSRKDKNVMFREQELWKLMKYMVKAIQEWKSAYSNERIGSICPFNLIIDSNGQVRLVCRLSFFNYEYSNASEVYSPPEGRSGLIPKGIPNEAEGIDSWHIYSIGMVILQALTLQLSGLSLLQTAQKLTILSKSQNYSQQLKGIIYQMLEYNQANRPKISDVEQLAKQHRNKHIS